MAPQLQDITPKRENLKNQEISKAGEQLEKPPVIEVEKKIEIEKIPETLLEKKPEIKKEAPFAPSVPIGPVPQAPAKSPTFEKIEDILEEDLENIYFQMPQQKQAELRQSGEETASRIEILLGGVKIKVKKILELVLKWLKIIPGINKFFLEQEAKIKTDEILKLREEKSKSTNQQNKI
jgi:hypothetical protein